MTEKEWTIPDLIDFEYFLSHGETPRGAPLEDLDRRIFLESVEPRVAGSQPGSPVFRRNAFRLWLEQRRAMFRVQEPHAVLPGDVFLESRSLLHLLVAAVGLASGAAVALSLLAYTGKAAVNVTMYLGVLVILQLVSLLFMLRFFFFKTSLGILRRHSILYGLLSRLMESIASRIAQPAMAGAVGHQRSTIRAASGLLRGMYGIYGQVLFWPFFAATQIFGVMFNAGAIGATLIRVFTSDLAFGWQSTLQMSSGVVHAVVRTLAAPWTWLLGPHACPSMEEIEGSRMVLKEGLSALATGNLVSWWPFMVLAVVFYGLLPRVLLLIIAVFGGHRALSRVRFTHAGCDQLMLRMRTPGISTAGVPDGPVPLHSTIEQPASREAVYLTYMDAAVLIPEEIINMCDESEFAKHLGANLGLKPAELLPITGSIDKDRRAVESAVRGHDQDDRAVVLVQEAWLPPIAETFGLIREIRACSGRSMRIAVLLIGKPSEGTILTPVRKSDKAIWNKALAGLADPYLSMATTGEA